METKIIKWLFGKKDKPKRMCIGYTANCANCFKPINFDGRVLGTGHFVNENGKIILANFCNETCLRNKGWFWNGDPWIEQYGLIKWSNGEFEL
jgi:hypothetical protein